MIRIPALVVGLLCAYGIAFVGCLAALWFRDGRVMVVMLPASVAIGSFIAGRWSERPAPVPGLAIGVLMLAAQAGVGVALRDNLQVFLPPGVAVLELLAAFTGALAGTLIARRAAEQLEPATDYTPLS